MSTNDFVHFRKFCRFWWLSLPCWTMNLFCSLHSWRDCPLELAGFSDTKHTTEVTVSHLLCILKACKALNVWWFWNIIFSEHDLGFKLTREHRGVWLLQFCVQLGVQILNWILCVSYFCQQVLAMTMCCVPLGYLFPLGKNLTPLAPCSEGVVLALTHSREANSKYLAC